MTTRNTARIVLVDDHERVLLFRVRVAALEVDTAGFQPDERRLVNAHRWWSRSEIDTADELVLPIGLRPLLDRLLAGERPDPPVELPWRTPDTADQ